jgi:hypothetical protein
MNRIKMNEEHRVASHRALSSEFIPTKSRVRFMTPRRYTCTSTREARERDLGPLSSQPRGPFTFCEHVRDPLPRNIKTFRDLTIFFSKIDCHATRETI